MNQDLQVRGEPITPSDSCSDNRCPCSYGREAGGIKARLNTARMLIALEVAFLSFASISLLHAAATALGRGIDLKFFQELGGAWLERIYQAQAWQSHAYPPFSVVLFSPLSLLSFDKLRIAWLALNLAATAVTLYLAIRLWGEDWPKKAQLYLSALMLSWAPFRVALRNGQISIMITALLLGAILARKRKRHLLAGALLGLALCKPSLSFPFLLYFVWKLELKIVGAAVLVPALLTCVFASRLNLPVTGVLMDYLKQIDEIYFSDSGATEIRPLLLALAGGNERLSAILSIALSIIALAYMAIVFRGRPQHEGVHFAAIALFALWCVYHRIYDSVLCIIPAALFVGLIVERRFVPLSIGCLAGLTLLGVSGTVVLTDGLESPLANAPVSMLLHMDRILVFGIFGLLLFLIWRLQRCEG